MHLLPQIRLWWSSSISLFCCCWSSQCTGFLSEPKTLRGQFLQGRNTIGLMSLQTAPSVPCRGCTTGWSEAGHWWRVCTAGNPEQAFPGYSKFSEAPNFCWVLSMAAPEIKKEGWKGGNKKNNQPTLPLPFLPPQQKQTARITLWFATLLEGCYTGRNALWEWM